MRLSRRVRRFLAAAAALSLGAVALPLLGSAARSEAAAVTAASPSFAPLPGLVRPGLMLKSAVGTHVVVVVPLYLTTPPTTQDYRGLVSWPSSFWSSQVPGLKFSWKKAAARKVPRSVACSETRAVAYAEKVARVDVSKPFVHVLAWAPECAIVTSNSVLMQYDASISAGRGWMWVTGAESEDVLHAFGGNLGLPPSSTVSCRSATGGSVPLSARCASDSGMDFTDPLGRLYLPGQTRLSGFYSLLLTTRVRTVPTTSPSSLRLVTRSSARGTLVAQMLTNYGTVAFDYSPGGSRTVNDYPNARGVQVRVNTTSGQAALNLPDSFGRMSPASDGTLELGDYWDVPGTGLRAIVTSVSASAASMSFVRIGNDRRSPTPPTVTSAGSFCANQSYVATWTPSSDASGILGYLVQVGTSAVVHVAKSAGSVSLGDGWFSTATSSSAPVRVWAVDGTGLRNGSVARAVTAVPPRVDTWVNGVGADTATSLPMSGDVIVGFAAPAECASQVGGWSVSYGDGSTDPATGDPLVTTVHLAPSTTGWSIPSDVLTAQRSAPSGSKLSLTVAADGLLDQGRVVVGEVDLETP